MEIQKVDGKSVNGEEIEGTGKERFTRSSEMDDLMRLAGIIKF